MRDPNDFLSRLVTMDETWLYHYDTETKQQSMEWRHRGSPLPALPQKIPSAKIRWKSSRLEFCDQDGTLLFDYLPKGQTINSSLLAQLMDIFKEKHQRRGKVTNGVLFLHENAPAHRALTTQKKPAYLDFQCLDRPPCSPGLAPLGYHLFPRLEKQLKGRHFSSDA